MLRILIALTTCLGILAAATVATAQTATPTQTTTPTQSKGMTKPATPTQPTTSTSTSKQGPFDKLSPGNQKIARALYDGQVKPSGTTSSTSVTQPKPYSLDQIAAMKQHKGWGEIFKQMKANGQIPPNVKNLGQLVSGKYHSGTSTTITSGSGRSQVVGKPEHGSKSGKGQMDSDSAGGNSGRGSQSSSPGGGSSGSGAGMSRPGVSGQGGGRGK